MPKKEVLFSTMQYWTGLYLNRWQEWLFLITKQVLPTDQRFVLSEEVLRLKWRIEEGMEPLWYGGELQGHVLTFEPSDAI